MKLNPLTPDEERVIAHKGIERPFTRLKGITRITTAITRTSLTASL